MNSGKNAAKIGIFLVLGIEKRGRGKGGNGMEFGHGEERESNEGVGGWMIITACLTKVCSLSKGELTG